MRNLQVNASHIKILQLTDLHLGEDARLDTLTLSLMRTAFQTEQPDLAVFSGDLVSGYAVWSEKERELTWRRALSVSEEFRVPFATLFGNHDDQPFREDSLVWNKFFLVLLALSLILFALTYMSRMRWRLRVLAAALVCACGYVMTAQSKATRMALLHYEQQAFRSLSYSGQGPSHIHGASNYRIVVLTTSGPVALFFIDSGGGRIPEDIHTTQIHWLNSMYVRHMPAIAFVHISPFPADIYNSGCEGSPPSEQSSSVSGGMALLDALANRNVSAVFFGHDHGNDWCCQYKGMLACYGKHSGFGGYFVGSECPGARIIHVYGNGTVFTRVIHLTRQDQMCQV
jgi:hypothetical protein